MATRHNRTSQTIFFWQLRRLKIVRSWIRSWMNYEKKKKALELGIYGSMTQRRSYITQPMDLDDPANRSFWTRNRTECLLRLLTEQAQLTGDVSSLPWFHCPKLHFQIDHESVADKMTALLSLPIAMKKQNISDRLEAMFAKYQWEQSRSQASGSKANWIWNEQLQYIIELLQERESNEDEKSPVQKIKTEHPSPSVIVINDDSSSPVAVSSPQKTPHSSISIPEVKPLIAGTKQEYFSSPWGTLCSLIPYCLFIIRQQKGKKKIKKPSSKV